MKRRNKQSYRIDGFGVVIVGDSSRPRKDSKRLNPKRLRQKRKLAE